MTSNVPAVDTEAWRRVRLRPRSELTVTDLGDELVLLDPRTQEMFALDPAGRFVWNALTDAPLGAVAKRLAEHYGLDVRTAERDVADLVAELLEADLLEPVQPSPSSE